MQNIQVTNIMYNRLAGLALAKGTTVKKIAEIAIREFLEYAAGDSTLPEPVTVSLEGLMPYRGPVLCTASGN